MDAITYSNARATLASTMDKVCQAHEPLMITRNDEQSVVMLSLEDFNSLEETAYLLSSPSNAKRLMNSIDQLKTGQGQVGTLVESLKVPLLNLQGRMMIIFRRYGIQLLVLEIF